MGIYVVGCLQLRGCTLGPGFGCLGLDGCRVSSPEFVLFKALGAGLRAGSWCEVQVGCWVYAVQ